jgi:hypothetical protein
MISFESLMMEEVLWDRRVYLKKGTNCIISLGT